MLVCVGSRIAVGGWAVSSVGSVVGGGMPVAGCDVVLGVVGVGVGCCMLGMAVVMGAGVFRHTGLHTCACASSMGSNHRRCRHA